MTKTFGPKAAWLIEGPHVQLNTNCKGGTFTFQEINHNTLTTQNKANSALRQISFYSEYINNNHPSFDSLPPRKRENTRFTQKYPRVNKIPGNTRSNISTLFCVFFAFCIMWFYLDW